MVAEASKRTKILILVGFVPVAGIFVWGAMRAPLDPGEALETCMTPYFDAVDAERYDEAWERHTTAGYRRAHAKGEFRAALETHRRERGRIVSRGERIENGFANVDGRSGFHFRYWFGFERGDPVNVVYTVVHQDDGTWRIDGALESIGRAGRPGPW
ncbi:MAG: hypothetical protein HYY06_03325 [Deltaproteobacteria bacterium]|nr:hypothetical protein [Deltaproteobacteria bacterium]